MPTVLIARAFRQQGSKRPNSANGLVRSAIRNERHSLDDTLCLFAAGADDVLRKPVHVREIVARVGAINRRVFGEKGNVTIGELRVYFDGREPEVNGEPFPLPR